MEKVIDTLNDLPNVLWIVSEEAPANSTWWNDHQISHVRAYESKKPHQHPIGYGALIGSPDTTIYNSDADWVAPQARISPTTSCGSGKPACKVNVNDSDHSYFGMWNDTAATESQLCMAELHERQSSAVHGPLRGVLPARRAEHVCLSNQRDLQWAGHAMGQLPGQPWVHFEIFPQVESCQRHSTQLSLFDRVLSGADSIGRCGVPGLRTVRRLVHDRPLSDARFTKIGGRVVQPIHRSVKQRKVPFPLAPPHNHSLPRSAETRYSISWIRRATQPQESRTKNRSRRVLPFGAQLESELKRRRAGVFG